MTYIDKYMSLHNFYIKHIFMLINDTLFENLLLFFKKGFFKDISTFFGF